MGIAHPAKKCTADPRCPTFRARGRHVRSSRYAPPAHPVPRRPGPMPAATAARDRREVAGLHQRQGGRGDVQPGAEPGDRAGAAGPEGHAGRRRLRPGEPRFALRTGPRVRPGRRAGRRSAAGRRDRRRARRDQDRPRRARDEDDGRGPGRRPEAAGQRAGRARSRRRLPADRRRERAEPVDRRARRGGRRGGAGDHARADFGGRRACGLAEIGPIGDDPPGRESGRQRRRGRGLPVPDVGVEPAIPGDGRLAPGVDPLRPARPPGRPVALAVPVRLPQRPGLSRGAPAGRGADRRARRRDRRAPGSSRRCRRDGAWGGWRVSHRSSSHRQRSTADRPGLRHDQ